MQDFLQFLADLRSGKALDDYQKELLALRDAVAETGKPGTLTLQFILKPASKGNRVMFSVVDKLAIKKPVGEQGETVLFAASGRFSRYDPRQPELPVMRDVSATLPRQEGEAANG